MKIAGDSEMAMPKPKPGQRLLSKAEVCERLGYSYTTIFKWIGEYKFPKGITLDDTPNSKVFWREEVIDEWIANRPRQKVKRHRPRLKPKGGSDD